MNLSILQHKSKDLGWGKDTICENQVSDMQDYLNGMQRENWMLPHSKLEGSLNMLDTCEDEETNHLLKNMTDIGWVDKGRKSLNWKYLKWFWTH